jgi:bifunctional oligoribonuclease and PAP phosphatase NrnA
VKPSEIKALKQLLSIPQKIVIVTHWSPDGDAMGSSLGLYNFLNQQKHKITVVTPNDYPSFLHWLPGNNLVLDYSKKPADVKKKISQADLICCLDFNSLKRIGDVGDLVAKAKAKKMIIDHHLEPEKFADFLLHKVEASSTCELVYDFITLMGDSKKINSKIANCLYTGIMTDTGSFRFPSTTPKTHRIVAHLIESGAKNAEIHQAIYDDSSEGKLRLLGFCLAEKLTVLKDYSTAFFTLTEAELKHYNYKKGDTEGVVNYALSMNGIKLAAFFVERDEQIKTSFRSKGTFDVNTFARKHFNGGGHMNAAGGSLEISLDETVSHFVNVLAEYKKQLSKN